MTTGEALQAGQVCCGGLCWCCVDDADVEARTGKELKKFLTPDVTRRMRTLWSRIDDEDYNSKTEEDFLFYELMQTRELLRRRLTDKQRASWFRQFKRCWRNDPTRIGKVRPKMPYHESKRLAAHFRAFFWLFILELSSFISDVLFLFVLQDLENDLFQASLAILMLAVLVRLISSLSVITIVDKKRWGLFLAGLVAGLAETNTSLVLIKQSFKRVDKDGLKIYKSSGRLSRQQEKDPVAVLARNNVNAGWAELRNILSVTVVEDIPQLVIQLIYLERQREELSLFFIFAIVTTTLHIIFQWVEFAITYSWIVRAVPKIQQGREIEFNRGKQYEFQNKGVFCSSTSVLSLDQVCERYNLDVRHLDLHLSEENTKDEDMVVVANNCPHLVFIGLAGTAITNDGLRTLTGIKNLRRVDLGSTGVSDAGIVELATACQRIVGVNLHATAVGDEAIEALAENCKGLIHLNVDKTNITQAGVNALATHCKKLEILSVKSNMSIDDGCIMGLAERCTTLAKIYLEETNVGDDAVAALATHCPALRGLNLKSTAITDAALHSLADNARSLKSLTLSSCENVSDAGIVYFAEGCAEVCTKLSKIYLADTAVENAGVIAIAQNCPNLTTIMLQRAFVTDAAIIAIAEHSKLIDRMIFDETSVGDAGLQALANAEPEKLTQISLAKCLVTESTVVELVKKCRQLTYINLDSNLAVMNSGVKQIARFGKNLQTVSMKLTGVTDFKPLTSRRIQVDTMI